MLFNYVVAILLIIIGLYNMIRDKNLIKIVLGLSIIDYGINLFIVSAGYNYGGTGPIFTMNEIRKIQEMTGNVYFVDPVPQALTLTSIVIGACIDAMALALVIKIFKKYKSVNTDEIRRLRG